MLGTLVPSPANDSCGARMDKVYHVFVQNIGQHAVMDSGTISKLRLQLNALGLIHTISKTNPNTGHTFLAWSMTDKGRRYLAQQRAVKR
jgi:hypothetical protein